ncbi:MAG: SEL1-like repeat protein [Neisseria sp.]|nr:SEL1-like repeat protein [Neisseria sp.]
MYYNGRGVVKDLKQAEYWWKKAAAHQGYQDAVRNLKLLNGR